MDAVVAHSPSWFSLLYYSSVYSLRWMNGISKKKRNNDDGEQRKTNHKYLNVSVTHVTVPILIDICSLYSNYIFVCLSNQF